ncbi:unnamed protein product [Pipistrellus nathusii]|uniref:Uncharacterized protein n=1 Tax=Pipistrellus nathusii TaxID=59473 RepID=A0ABN9ZA94_PIPNA
MAHKAETPAYCILFVFTWFGSVPLLEVSDQSSVTVLSALREEDTANEGSTDSLLTRETMLLFNKMNTYKWFSSMENEDHHFLPDMKSCQGRQNLTSCNTWRTWDSSSKASQTTAFPKDSGLLYSGTDDWILNGQNGEAGFAI